VIKKILILFSFVLCLSAIVGFAVYQGVFNITKVKVNVVEAPLNYDIDSLITSGKKSLNDVTGKPIFLFSLKEAYKKLTKDPRVKDIKLQRKFPNQINIDLIPKQVMASMMSFKYGLHALTKEGDVLPVKYSKQDIDLPILRGSNFHKDEALRVNTIRLLSEIPDKGLFSKQNISEVRYDKKNGFIIYLNGQNSIVKLGKNEFKKKSSYIERAMSYLESQKMEGRVIDARYSKKVVVKLRNEP